MRWRKQEIYQYKAYLRRPPLFLILFLIIFLSSFDIAYYDFLVLPSYQSVVKGESIVLPEQNYKLPVIAIEKIGDSSAVSSTAAQPNDLNNSYEVQLSINGILPFKTINVKERDPIDVITGGHSIGVLLQTDGVTVVGISAVIDKDKQPCYPAGEAGIKVGDFITSINNQKIHTNEQIATIINKAGTQNQKCVIKYIRNNKEYETTITPLHCMDTNSFRIGLYVRDNTAGVGTLTFYDPDTEIYGALGHSVSDLEHGVKGKEKGVIVRASIQSIKIGIKGTPGEKIGVFVNDEWRGNIAMNGTFGIFGSLEQEVDNNILPDQLEVATISQVKTGAAKMYTVIDGEKIESFNINIVKLMPNYKSAGKGMIIEVVDKDLLSKTGGIIQGMSGSPIVQNGKLVGAVSHVFVNDPTRGYACFSEWMIEEAGLID